MRTTSSAAVLIDEGSWLRVLVSVSQTIGGGGGRPGTGGGGGVSPVGVTSSAATRHLLLVQVRFYGDLATRGVTLELVAGAAVLGTVFVAAEAVAGTMLGGDPAVVVLRDGAVPGD